VGEIHQALEQGLGGARDDAPVPAFVLEPPRAARQGAEVILLGCTCMAKTAPLIEERFQEVPVVESARSALKVTLDATPVPRNRTAIAGLVPQLVDAWVDGAPSPQLPADDCEVCVQVEAAAPVVAA
jgi:hypothetical protein